MGSGAGVYSPGLPEGSDSSELPTGLRSRGPDPVQRGKRDAVSHGLSYMKLHVEAENAGARRLYQRHGYEETAAGEGADPGDTRLVLRKWLPDPLRRETDARTAGNSVMHG